MSLVGALRRAATDLYFNSWRLAPANLVWAVVLLLALFVGPATLLGMTLLVATAVPLAGVYRMSALIARGEPVAFSDFLVAMRQYALRAMGTAAGAGLLAVVFLTNVVVGLQATDPVGWFVSAMGLWGAVCLALFIVAWWPLLVDPRRDGLGVRRRMALAGLAVIGQPARMLALSLTITLILIGSAVLFAALLLLGVAYTSLVSTNYVLPLVDGLEARVPEGRLPG